MHGIHCGGQLHTICCEEVVTVTISVQPLYLVDFLFNFKGLEIIKLWLVALELYKKFVFGGLLFFLFPLCSIFVLVCVKCLFEITKTNEVYLATLKYNHSSSPISSSNIFPCFIELYCTHNVHYKK